MAEIVTFSKEDMLGKTFPAFLRFFRASNLERFPEEKPWDEDVIRKMMSVQEDNGNRFIATENGEIIGYSSVGKWLNDKTGSFLCSVLRDHRNKGLGAKLATLSLSRALEQGYTSVFAQTYNEAGERFAKKLGGEVIGRQSTRILDLGAVNWSLVHGWIENATLGNVGIKTIFQTTISDSQIEPLAKVSLEISDELFSLNRYKAKSTIESEMAEWKRRQDESNEPGKTRLFLFSSDPDGQVLGYTFCVINSSDPSFVTQGMTAVPAKFRRQGIGKLLKASMLVHLKENYPQAKTVRTFNNDLNAPMVAINDKLGFERKTVYTDFIMETSVALDQLKQKT